MSHHRRFIERHLPRLIDVSELSDEQVDFVFDQIVGCELGAETIAQSGERIDWWDWSAAADVACPRPRSPKGERE